MTLSRKRKAHLQVAKRAKKLIVGTYAFGCRGHPGVVHSKYYWPGDPFGADVEIKSLVDDVIESCSIFYCAPEPTSKEHAEEYASYMKAHGQKMALLKFSPYGYMMWEDQYHEGKAGNPEYKDLVGDMTLQEYMFLDDKEFAFYLEQREKFK